MASKQSCKILVLSQRTRQMYLLFGSALGIFIGSIIMWNVLTLDCSDCSIIPQRMVYMLPRNGVVVSQASENIFLPSPPPSIEESLLVLLLPSEDSTLEKLSASAHTWGKTVPKLMIFVDKDYPLLSVPSNVQLVRMFETDHLYSTIGLLQILEHLYKLEFRQWEWFFFIPETVYVNSFVGSEFLSLNTQSSSDVVYVGSEPQETTDALSYCAKEGGVLVNRATIEKMVENLSVCRKWSSLYSWDKGLGKCISEVSSAQCTLKLSKYFLKEEQEISFTSLLYRDSTYNHAFSIYPVTTPTRMYSLHYFYSSHEYLRLSERVESLSRMMTESCSQLPDHITETSEEIQLGCDFIRPQSSTLLHSRSLPFRPKNHLQYRTWSYFNMREVYMDDKMEPRLYIKLYKYIGFEYKRALDQVTREVNKKYGGRNLKLKLWSLINGYVRNDPLIGNEYIIDAVYICNNNTQDTVQERVRLLQLLDNKYTVRPTIAYSSNTITVNIIVPISGVTQRCYEYIDMFNKLYSQENRLRLILVVFGEEVRKIIEKVSSSLTNIHVIKGIGTFSRSRALDQGMRTLQGGDLAFLCDVDLIIKLPFFNRCRRNTVKGEMVYYPEVFKLYNSKFIKFNQNQKISRKQGHWVNYGYGMLCIYKSDYDSVGGLNTTMLGWGGEDVDFYEKVFKSKLEVLKSPDTGLVHRWHQNICTEKTTTKLNYKACVGSRAETLGEKSELAKYVYNIMEKYPELLTAWKNIQEEELNV